jgi:site-specific recombinase XerD
MVTDIHWNDATREFLLHVQATRAPKTHRFYSVQLRQLVKWAESEQVSFTQFGKRHLDRFLVERGKSVQQTTLHHDAVSTKAFYRWCAKNDLLERNPLMDYEVRRAPAPARYMPGDEDIRALLKALAEYWNPSINADARYVPPVKRIFHRERNNTIFLGLLDTCCRIGELLSLKVDDCKLKEREILIRQSKGREPRTIPISTDWADAIEIWLRQRQKAMGSLPEGEDEGWLFVSEFGQRVDEHHMLKVLKRVLRFAGLSDQMTLHSLRRYSLNRLAKVNLLATQAIAGHKEPKTTLLYTKLDADFVRDVHSAVGVVKNILNSKREVRRRRIV